MPSIIPGRKYTFAELAAMRDDPAMAQWAAQGYVWRQELDGTLRLVHYSRSHMDNEVENPRGYVDTRPFEEIFPKEPIRKRTPQERRRSLVDRWWKECQKAGTVPGLSDEQMTALIGREWKTGQTELTISDIERMAAAMLQDAENKFEASEAKKVTRTAPSD